MQDRYILILGTNGSGKTTIANRILKRKDDESQTIKGHNIVDCIAGVLNTENGELNVTVIYEDGISSLNQKDNCCAIEKVLKSIKVLAPDGINLVFFVVREGRFTAAEKQAILWLISRLPPDISRISALIFTHCEGKTKEARKRYITNFTASNSLAYIVNFMAKGCFTVGFPRNDDTSEALESQILADIDMLHEIILSSSEKVTISTQCSNTSKTRYKYQILLALGFCTLMISAILLRRFTHINCRYCFAMQNWMFALMNYSNPFVWFDWKE